MSETISVGQLRQNPTSMIRAVRQGATYTLTDHGEPVADIVPHHEQTWRPIAEVAAMLADMGPDVRWADEYRQNRLEIDLENPWETAR